MDNKNNKILCKDVFDKKIKTYNIIIVKNLGQDKTFVFNKKLSLAEDWNLMYNNIKNNVIDKDYELNSNAYCIQIINQKKTIKSYFKKLLNK